MAEAILETHDLTKRFGGITATDEVSLSFDADDLTAIIGPNGAGKSTFFGLLTGEHEPTDGRIRFKGEDITDQPATTIARKGLVKSYQITQVFEELTVLENVRIAAQAEDTPYDFWNRRRNSDGAARRAREILERLGLEDQADAHAGSLSHGEQRTLELAIAIGADPEMLLLDEPTAGMSPEETTEMMDLIEDLGNRLPLVLIEHKMSVVMETADRIVVFHKGRKIADGSPSEIRGDEKVQEVYLGGI